MLDIKFLRKNPDVVKQNIRNKFQNEKLAMVDEVIALDKKSRKIKQEVEILRAAKNKISKKIGKLIECGKKEEVEKIKKNITASGNRIENLTLRERKIEAEIRQRMIFIPQIIDSSVPIGKDDSENVEIQKYGDPIVPDFEIPHHTDIMKSFNGIDLDSARRVAGNGFYYLMGDISRLH